jgi:alpha-tubulin suppressor-like RCC1 family protein
MVVGAIRGIFSLSRSLLAVGAVGVTVVAAANSAERSSSLYSWGMGSHGQLGTGNESNAASPMLVDAAEGVEIATISAGGHCSAFITERGDLFTWGNGNDGQLGHGSEVNESLPRQVMASTPIRWSQVSCGRRHMAAVDTDGHAYSWGFGKRGRLGHGNNKSVPSPKVIEFEGLSSAGNVATQIRKVACGDHHTLFLAADGTVYSCGGGTMRGRDDLPTTAMGAQATRTADVSRPQPVETPPAQEIVDIAAGNEHSLALSASGRVFAWGRSTFGQLGLGADGQSSGIERPTLLSSLAAHRIVAIAAGGFHSLALSATGEVYAWGCGSDGQLGGGGSQDLKDTPLPVLVDLSHIQAEGDKVVSIQGGGSHSALITASGKVYLWGKGREGQLGQGDKLQSATFRRSAPVLLSTGQWKQSAMTHLQVALGEDHSLCVRRLELVN